MKLRSEIADRLDADTRLDAFPESRACFRQGGVREILGFGGAGKAIAKAVLEVLGQYEEVEVVRCEGNSERWLRLPGKDGHLYNPLNLAPVAIYMRKPEPAPDLKELARRAVKAYREGALDQRKTMAALEKKLDE